MVLRIKKNRKYCKCCNKRLDNLKNKKQYYMVLKNQVIENLSAFKPSI